MWLSVNWFDPQEVDTNHNLITLNWAISIQVVIHFKNYLQDNDLGETTQGMASHEKTESGKLIPFLPDGASSEVSRVQIASLVDKLMQMPEDIEISDDYISPNESLDPYQCIAEKIISDF